MKPQYVGRYDDQGREIVSDVPCNLHLQRKPKAKSLGERVREQVQLEMQRRAVAGFDQAPITREQLASLDGDGDEDEVAFGISPYQMVEDPLTGRPVTRSAAQATAQLLAAKQIAAAKAAAAHPKDKPEPQPASGGDQKVDASDKGVDLERSQHVRYRHTNVD